MVSLDDKVRALAVTAGWKTPRPGQDGSYSFRLEDGLDLKVFSPDGRLCFLLADLHALPEPGHERDSLLRKVAGQQAGICRERASVVALERQEDAVARGLDGERLIFNPGCLWTYLSKSSTMLSGISSMTSPGGKKAWGTRRVRSCLPCSPCRVRFSEASIEAPCSCLPVLDLLLPSGDRRSLRVFPRRLPVPGGVLSLCGQ